MGKQREYSPWRADLTPEMIEEGRDALLMHVSDVSDSAEAVTDGPWRYPSP